MSKHWTFFVTVFFCLFCSSLILNVAASTKRRPNRKPATAPRRTFEDKDIDAYHFHVYFYDQNRASVAEALAFRKATRHQIETGFLDECALNQILLGPDGPHPYSQFELCCNKTSFPEATAWHMQNHGNLSVLVHPLTLEDLDDHSIRASWMGSKVPLDFDCNGCLVETLPEARICPKYPYYPDRLPKGRGPQFKPLVGTENYHGTTVFVTRNESSQAHTGDLDDPTKTIEYIQSIILPRSH